MVRILISGAYLWGIFFKVYIHLWYGAFIELGYQTDRGPTCLGQYDGQGVYCGLSTASEVFLIFTTQIYTFVCNYNAICLTSKQEGSIATGILLTPGQYSPLLTSGG